MSTKNVVKDTMILTYTRIIAMGTTLVYGMILARALTKYEYGVYSQAQIIISFAVTFLGLSLPNCVNFFLPKATDDNDRKKILSNILSGCIIIGLIGAVLIAILSPFLSSYFNQDELKIILLIGAFLPLCQLISAVYDNTFVVISKTKLVAIRRTVIAVLKVVLSVVLLLLHLSFELFYFCILLIEISVAIYSICSLLKEAHFRLFCSMDMSFIIQAFKYALPLGLATVVGIININIGKMIISKQMGPEELATYTNMTNELPITIIATSIAAVGVPLVSKYLSQNKKKEVLNLWNNSVELSFISTSWIVGLLIVLAPEVITFLYSEKYLSGVGIFRIASLVLLMRTVYFGMILNGSGNTSKILSGSVLAIVSNTLFLIILYPLLGVYGAVISTLIAVVSVNLFQLYQSCKVINCTFKEVFPWKNLSKNILQNCGIAIPCILLADWIRSFNLNIFVNLVLVSLLWFIVIGLISYRRFIELKNELCL